MRSFHYHLTCDGNAHLHMVCAGVTHMKKPAARSYVLAVASLMSAVAAHGQILFQDNFDTTPVSNWTINAGTTRDQAVIGFDYSTVGIPAAPNSGGTTIGAMLQANQPGTTTSLSGVSISPVGQSFTGDYQLRYDLWENFPGPGPGGGTGSTQLTAGGIMTSGNVATFAGSGDGLWFAATGEGGSTQDYRVYYNGVNQTTAALYPAGGQNSTLAYYTTAFPGGVSAPAAQTTLFSQQTGTTAAGSIGWAWHDVTITKVGNLVSWDVDGVRLANVDLSTTPAFGGNNILFAQADINTNQTTVANAPVLFGVIDNVRVTAVPEPSTFALVGLAALALAIRAKKQ
jgi:hypothetical protein